MAKTLKRGQTVTQVETIVDDGMILVDEATRRPLYKGQVIKDFRGVPTKVVGGYAPRHAASSGRVTVEEKGRAFDKADYFPGVVDAKWVPMAKAKFN